MTEWLAQQILTKMRFNLSISRPGSALNEKMALEIAIDALEKKQQEGERQNEPCNINGTINP